MDYYQIPDSHMGLIVKASLLPTAIRVENLMSQTRKFGEVVQSGTETSK